MSFFHFILFLLVTLVSFPSYSVVAEKKGFLWGLNKSELYHSKKSLKNFKEGHYNLSGYYFNKVSNKHMKEFLVWVFLLSDLNKVKTDVSDVDIQADFGVIYPNELNRNSIMNIFNKKKTFIPVKSNISTGIDDLLWRSRLAEAEGKIANLDKSHHTNDVKLLKLRIALQRQKNIAVEDTALIKNNLYLDHGLTYDYTAWLVKHPEYYVYAPQILLNIPYEMHQKHSKKWWYLSKRCIREIIYNKNSDYYSYAYQLAKMHRMHGYKKGLAEGEWLAGWLAIEFLDQPIMAYRHFIKLYENVTKPLSISRASYWLGRSSPSNAEKLKWYKRAMRYPTTFYAQVAMYESGENLKSVLSQHSNRPVYDFYKIRDNKFARYVYMASLLDENALASSITNNYLVHMKDPEEAESFIKLALKSGCFYCAISLAKELESSHGRVFLEDLYPVVYSDIHSLPGQSALTLSVIRQESRFDHKAVSSAGANGLMQLIPKTAVLTALQIGEKYSKDHIFFPSYNMVLGCNHLCSQMVYYQNSLILTIASYNAGSHNVDKWIRDLGDPRQINDIHGIVSWIEMMPFQETRDYVQYVISNLQVYRYILDKNISKENIKRDLTDGLEYIAKK